MTEENHSLDIFWMQHALELAERARSLNEVPVGAVVVRDDQIIGEGWNQPISGCDPTAHAEIIALRDAAKRIGNYRLLNTTLYATVEPCVMCAGAMIHARVSELVYGAPGPRTGAAGSVVDLLQHNDLNHHVVVRQGVLAEECSKIMQAFFAERR